MKKITKSLLQAKVTKLESTINSQKQISQVDKQTLLKEVEKLKQILVENGQRQTN